MINWAKTTKVDLLTIGEIVKRARDLLGIKDGLSLHMDVAATHSNCPLKLKELLSANNFNFAHDVYGIQRHINRETGKLENCFLPRFAQ